jgi:hypothetical protein
MRRGSRTVPQIDQRHAKPPAENAERGVARHHPQIAPKRQFQPPSYGIAFDGGDRRFRKQHARGPHGTIARFAQRIEPPCRDGLQVRTGTKGFPRTGQHGHMQGIVGIERSEGVRQRDGRRGIYGVARFRPVDRHDQD